MTLPAPRVRLILWRRGRKSRTVLATDGEPVDAKGYTHALASISEPARMAIRLRWVRLLLRWLVARGTQIEEGPSPEGPWRRVRDAGERGEPPPADL